MTKPKTSMEKLETRNESVTDLRSALLASRWKWREIEMKAREVGGLIDHKCGFCILAYQKRELDRGGGLDKCRFCPREVRDFCHKIQEKIDDTMTALDDQIEEVKAFLSDLKGEEDES